MLKRREQSFRDGSCNILRSLMSCSFAITCEDLEKIPQDIRKEDSVIIAVKECIPQPIQQPVL